MSLPPSLHLKGQWFRWRKKITARGDLRLTITSLPPSLLQNETKAHAYITAGYKGAEKAVSAALRQPISHPSLPPSPPPSFLKDETKAHAYVTAGYMGAEKAALEALREIYVANSSSFPPNTLVLVKDALAAKEEYKVRYCLPSLHRSFPPSLLFGMLEGSHLNDLKTDRSLPPSLPLFLLAPRSHRRKSRTS